MKAKLTIFAAITLLLSSYVFADPSNTTNTNHPQRDGYSSSYASSHTNSSAHSAIPRNNRTDGQGTRVPDTDRTNRGTDHNGHDHDHDDSHNHTLPNE